MERWVYEGFAGTVLMAVTVGSQGGTVVGKRHAVWAKAVVVMAILTVASQAAAGVCGNGIREGNEQCDGSDLGGFSCQHLCTTGGFLGCFPDCTFDQSACAICGNNVQEAGEVCDGEDLAGAVCLEGGVLGCRVDCQGLDETGCFICGNGQKEGTEECDAPDVGGAMCDEPGETGGSVSCTPGCQLDRSTCFRCGNCRVEVGEECDDGNDDFLDGCTPGCEIECGNATVERNEECDDGSRLDGDGCSGSCILEERFGGGGGESLECNLEWGVTGVTPQATVDCEDGEVPCDRDMEGGECTFLVTFCFNVAQAVIGDPPPGLCIPTNVARVALTGPSLAGDTALRVASQDGVVSALKATLAQVDGAVVTRTGVVVEATPAIPDDICGNLLLTVPAGEVRDLAVEVIDGAGGADVDQMAFGCAASTSVSPQHERCITGLNKNLAKVTTQAGRQFRRCLKSASRGTLPGTIEGCVENDSLGRIRRAEEKTAWEEARHCAPDPPSFGATNAATVNEAAVRGAIHLTKGILGSDMDIPIAGQVDDGNASRCQQKVLQEAYRCQDYRFKIFNRCKKDGLRSGGVASKDRLALCVGLDPQEKVSRRCDPVMGKNGARFIPAVCVRRGVDLSDAFPGCGGNSALELASCIDTVGRCRFCMTLKTADGLGDACDCDLFDDGDATNGSCLSYGG